jgi:enolase
VEVDIQGMAKITSVHGREVLDSRGNPTVQAVVVTSEGAQGEAKVPSGVSTGRHETVELRDQDPKRYRGLGVQQAVRHIDTEIQAALVGKDTGNQSKVDRVLLELDGTPNKSRLGGNAVLAVSLAVARAEAAEQGIPLYMYLQQLFPRHPIALPVPQLNLINGGRHAQNNLSIQEYHVVPVGAPSFSRAVQMGVEIYQTLRDVLTQEGLKLDIGDEAGFAPSLSSSEQAFTLLVRAIELAGYVPGVDVVLGIDAAATEFYEAESKSYQLDGSRLSAPDLAYTYKQWRERYPLLSFEDPFAEDEWPSWQQFMKVSGSTNQIVGDDLYASNVTRLREGITRGATNAILIKPNQVGTLTETLQTVLLAQEAKHNVIISHRSGETEDTFIADLAVAVGAGQIKTGAPLRSDRTAKYNRLLEIEDETKAPLAHSLQPFLEHFKPQYEQATAALPVVARPPL